MAAMQGGPQAAPTRTGPGRRVELSLGDAGREARWPGQRPGFSGLSRAPRVWLEHILEGELSGSMAVRLAGDAVAGSPLCRAYSSKESNVHRRCRAHDRSRYWSEYGCI